MMALAGLAIRRAGGVSIAEPHLDSGLDPRVSATEKHGSPQVLTASMGPTPLGRGVDSPGTYGRET